MTDYPLSQLYFQCERIVLHTNIILLALHFIVLTNGALFFLPPSPFFSFKLFMGLLLLFFFLHVFQLRIFRIPTIFFLRDISIDPVTEESKFTFHRHFILKLCVHAYPD